MKIIKTINKDYKNIKHDKNYDAKYYKGRVKSVLLYENMAYILINTIGIDNAKYVGDKMAIIGFVGLFISFLFLVVLNGLGSSLVNYPYNLFLLTFFIIILLIGFFVFIFPTNHYKSTICERCKRDFAYKEDCKPDIREIKTRNGTITKYITRRYKCCYCGNKRNVSETIVIEPIYYSDMV